MILTSYLCVGEHYKKCNGVSSKLAGQYRYTMDINQICFYALQYEKQK
jgi:hypothetical protein